MFGTESQIDASFYQLIHDLAPTPKPDRESRRSNERQPFLADHRIAPDRGMGFPDESEFIRVRCHDLTRSGFSFFLPERPEFAKLVAAFGEPPEVIYVRAEVIRFETVLVHPLGVVERINQKASRPNRVAATTHSARPMVLVGCRFTGRLEKPSQ